LGDGGGDFRGRYGRREVDGVAALALDALAIGGDAESPEQDFRQRSGGDIFWYFLVVVLRLGSASWRIARGL